MAFPHWMVIVLPEYTMPPAGIIQIGTWNMYEAIMTVIPAIPSINAPRHAVGLR
jgi:hypothetical protein